MAKIQQVYTREFKKAIYEEALCYARGGAWQSSNARLYLISCWRCQDKGFSGFSRRSLGKHSLDSESSGLSEYLKADLKKHNCATVKGDAR